ncbi:MAG TPA: hypothetical protein PK066_05710, partial [Saprospiraceae bacterium]|nr:hypothetical protein [Saprospiraceae bacterium]
PKRQYLLLNAPCTMPMLTEASVPLAQCTMHHAYADRSVSTSCSMLYAPCTMRHAYADRSVSTPCLC